MSEDTHDVQYEEYEENWTGRLIVAAVVALVLIIGAFFAGKAIAGDSGPATLAEAVQQAQKGTLPCGETANAAASPAATPDANGGPPPGAGGGFLLRGICNQDGQGAAGQGGTAGRGRFGGAGGFGGQTVTAVSADSITVQGPNGSSTIKLDSSTAVNKTSGASVADIKKGDSVIVGGGFGRPGGANAQDGAARSITILPQAAGRAPSPRTSR